MVAQMADHLDLQRVGGLVVLRVYERAVLTVYVLVVLKVYEWAVQMVYALVDQMVVQ